MALVVRAPGAAVTEDELIAYTKTRLAGYKCPKKVEFREPYWQGRNRQVN